MEVAKLPANWASNGSALQIHNTHRNILWIHVNIISMNIFLVIQKKKLKICLFLKNFHDFSVHMHTRKEKYGNKNISHLCMSVHIS